MNKVVRTLLLMSFCVTICGCSESPPAAEKTWQISFDDGADSIELTAKNLRAEFE